MEFLKEILGEELYAQVAAKLEGNKDVKLAMFEIDGNISIISGNENLKQTHHKRKVHKTLGELNN